jgi:multiple sugar transport system permease protein
MRRAGRGFTPYAMIAPAAILFLLMVAGPFVYSLILSTRQLDIFTDKYVGAANFVKLFRNPDFLLALRNTGLYSLVLVGITQVLGLGMALCAQAAVRMKKTARSIIYLSTRVSGIATLGVWLWIFYPLDGGINQLLHLIGLPALNWYARPTTAFALVCVVAALWNYGVYFLLYLAALDGQPLEIHDAARVDGANEWQRFSHITLPLLRRILLFQTITATIGFVQMWEAVAMLTGGKQGTTSLGYYLYDVAYRRGQYGMASAVSVVEMVIIILLILVQNRMLREK